MYTPPIESTDSAPKKSLSDLFKTDEVQQRHKELTKDKEYVKMEDVYDRPITIVSYSIAKEKSKFREEEQEFTRINFYFSDDEKKIKHQCRTQSASLTAVLQAVGNETITQQDGVPTMICMEKKGAKTVLYFAGLEDVTY